MSNNQNPATHQSPQLTIPLAWQQFIAQTLSPRSRSLQFPKQLVLSFCQSQKCPKVKQLLTYLHPLHKNYKQNCLHFKQLLILLYILLLKGCASISTQFISICMDVLQQLLKFRIIVICYSYQHNAITQVYSILVPSVFMWCDSQQKQRKNNRQKQKISQKQKQSPKTFITILQTINKTQQIDNLLIIFQCLLVVKIRNHLTAGSLFQFDSIMRKIYSEQKYKLVYQGKGCISHIVNKQKQKVQKQKQLAASSTIVISKLIPARNDQLSWQISELQLKVGNDEQTRKQKIIISKIQTETPMQQWVVNAFKSGIQPNKVPVVFNTFLTKMKTIEMYRFLCLLEIYGSSPNIQILNQYIPDDKILQIFTKFLLGENLVEYVASVSNKKQIIDGSLNKNLVYSYKNEKLLNILQLCMNQATKIKAFEEKNIFFEEFKTRFLKKQQKNNQQKGNNNDDAKQIQGTVNKNNLSIFQHNGKKLDDYWKK